MALNIKKHLSKRLLAIIAAVVVLAIAAVSIPQFVGERASSTEPAAESRTLKLGIPDINPVWDKLAEVAERDHDLKIEYVNFTDWHLPNTSLQAGELDGNAFQHTLFVSQFNANSGGTLRPVGSYGIHPSALYSSKHERLEDIPDGGSILVHKDPSNQGRALKLLEHLDVIKLKEGVGFFPGIDDVVENPRNLKLIELDGLQLASSLDDADAVYLYGHRAVQVGLDPEKHLGSDADLTDTEALLPYHGVFVAQEKDIDDPVWRTIEDIYHSAELAEVIEQETKGQTTLVKNDPQKLRDLQQDAEAQIKGEN